MSCSAREMRGSARRAPSDSCPMGSPGSSAVTMRGAVARGAEAKAGKLVATERNLAATSRDVESEHAANNYEPTRSDHHNIPGQ